MANMTMTVHMNVVIHPSGTGWRLWLITRIARMLGFLVVSKVPPSPDRKLGIGVQHEGAESAEELH